MIKKNSILMLFAVLAIAILFSSCSQETDEKPTTTTDNIQVDVDENTPTNQDQTGEEIDSTIDNELITPEEEVEIGKLI